MPKFLGVRWKVAGAFFLVILALITLLGLYLLDWTEGYYLRNITSDLRKNSLLLGRLAMETPPSELPSVVKQIGNDLGYRVTLIEPGGRVTADSETDFRQMTSHANRPEVKQALASGYGTSKRYSSTLDVDMLYIATAFERDGKVAGVARVAEPLSGLKEVMSLIQRTFLTAALLAVLLAAVVSVKLASNISRRIERISSVAERLSAGDLSARVTQLDEPLDETGTLALTFNSMADHLQAMIKELTEQKSRMQAVFDHSDDGLLLIDPQGRLRMINPAASNMLGVTASHAIGKTVIEGTLNHDLTALVSRVTKTREPAALDITLPTAEENAVHAYVAPLVKADGDIGAIAVLHDITAARRIDAIRRDFIANVSHELRTPLASIKAMAETILLRYKTDPAVAPQFAESIVQEADRMALLAEDLLDLAKIESGRRALKVEPVKLAELVEEVMDRLRPAADRKKIELVSKLEDETANADSDSLFQILQNLIDNAIKYSHEGDKVEVSAERSDDKVSISITDTGPGIPQEDLSRIFERFYRVDKARSRESGGTGLGLSIVKHLTELMGGKITVASEPGKGTTFTIMLPVG